MGWDELPDRRRKSNHVPRPAGANSRTGTVSLFDRHAPCFCTTQTSKSFSRMAARIEMLHMSARRLFLQTLPTMTEFTIPTFISSHESSRQDGRRVPNNFASQEYIHQQFEGRAFRVALDLATLVSPMQFCLSLAASVQRAFPLASDHGMLFIPNPFY